MRFPEFCEPLPQIIETEKEVGHGNPQFEVKSEVWITWGPMICNWRLKSGRGQSSDQALGQYGLC